MRILLDECLPLDFRHSFPNHDAHTAQWAGLKGSRNGELLMVCRSTFVSMTPPLPVVTAQCRRVATEPRPEEAVLTFWLRQAAREPISSKTYYRW
jgi:hypothetical protein